MGSTMQLELKIPQELLSCYAKLESQQCYEMQAAVNSPTLNCSLKLTRLERHAKLVLTGHVADLVEIASRKWRCVISSVSLEGSEPQLPSSEYTKLASLTPISPDDIKEEDEGSPVISPQDRAASIRYLSTLPIDSPIKDKVTCAYCQKVFKSLCAIQKHVGQQHSKAWVEYLQAISNENLAELVASRGTEAMVDHRDKAGGCHTCRRQLAFKENEKKCRTYAIKCGECKRVFQSEHQLFQHVESKHILATPARLNAIGISAKDIHNESPTVIEPSPPELSSIPPADPPMFDDDSDGDNDFCFEGIASLEEESDEDCDLAMKKTDDMKSPLESSSSHQVTENSGNSLPKNVAEDQKLPAGGSESGANREKKAGWVCAQCRKAFESSRALQTHMRFGHKNAEDENSAGVMDDKAARATSNKASTSASAGDAQDVLSKSTVINPSVVSAMGKGPFRCSHCGMTSTYKSALVRHIRRKHNSVPKLTQKRRGRTAKHIACVYCNFSWSGRQVLDHLKNLHSHEKDYTQVLADVCENLKILAMYKEGDEITYAKADDHPVEVAEERSDEIVNQHSEAVVDDVAAKKRKSGDEIVEPDGRDDESQSQKEVKRAKRAAKDKAKDAMKEMISSEDKESTSKNTPDDKDFSGDEISDEDFVADDDSADEEWRVEAVEDVTVDLNESRSDCSALDVEKSPEDTPPRGQPSSWMDALKALTFDLKCSLCEHRNNSMVNFRLHMLQKHQGLVDIKDIECIMEDQIKYTWEDPPDDLLIQCDFCDKRRPGRAMLNHMQVWHKDEEDYDERLRVVCEKLKEMGLSHESDFNKHMRSAFLHKLGKRTYFINQRKEWELMQRHANGLANGEEAEGSESQPTEVSAPPEKPLMQSRKKPYKATKYSCPKCSYSGSALAEMRRHLIRSHKDTMTRKTVDCIIEDMKHGNVGKHNYVHEMTCEICQKVRTGATLLNHLEVWHSDHPDYSAVLTRAKQVIDPKLPLIKRLAWNEQVKRGVCCHCKGEFGTREALMAHKKTCSKNKLAKASKLVCSTCDYQATSHADLMAHKKVQQHNVVRTGPLICEICGAVYLSHSGLLNHRVGVHNMMPKFAKKKEFKCNTCGKTFKHKNVFERHLITHAPGMFAKCDICNKSYKTAADLRVHVKRIHMNIYPYHCSKCGHGVQRKEWLKTHRCENVKSARQPRERTTNQGSKITAANTANSASTVERNDSQGSDSQSNDLQGNHLRVPCAVSMSSSSSSSIPLDVPVTVDVTHSSSLLTASQNLAAKSQPSPLFMQPSYQPSSIPLSGSSLHSLSLSPSQPLPLLAYNPQHAEMDTAEPLPAHNYSNKLSAKDVPWADSSWPLSTD